MLTYYFGVVGSLLGVKGPIHGANAHDWRMTGATLSDFFFEVGLAVSHSGWFVSYWKLYALLVAVKLKLRILDKHA